MPGSTRLVVHAFSCTRTLALCASIAATRASMPSAPAILTRYSDQQRRRMGRCVSVCVWSGQMCQCVCGMGRCAAGEKEIKYRDLSELVLNGDLTLQTHLKQIHGDGLEASCAHPISFTASFPSVFHVTAYSRVAKLSSSPLVRFRLSDTIYTPLFSSPTHLSSNE